MTTKKSHKLTLPDRLSRLTYISACQLLGENGPELIRQGAKYDDIDLDHDVHIGKDLFRLRLPCVSGTTPIVTITLMSEARKRLRWNCTTCETACAHVGAAFSLILEEKSCLGLATPPIEDIPLEHLGEDQLIERAIAERAERAVKEKFLLKSADAKRPWTDYVVTSKASGKTYRVALRGMGRGESFCSCPDFRTNTLGTCKHILHVQSRIERTFTAAQRGQPHRRRDFEVYLNYDKNVSLRFSPPFKAPDDTEPLTRPFIDRPIDDPHALLKCVARLERLGWNVVVFPDAEEYIQQRLFQERVAGKMAEIRRDPANHPLRKHLLATELLPYQLDGIAFAVAAGRAILADDMGLGKTIQGVGVAEILAREAGIKRVLVVCPASLKSQWRNEVERFSNRQIQLIAGSAEQRAEQYADDTFFTVCNYEQVLRDILPIEKVKWDLIILDEGQRIKNYESKTSNVIKGLRSPFALVLTGTPLENRLDELFSVVQFIDDRRLAPAFRFFNRHRIADDTGKVIGYTNLGELRQNLRPILLRRTRESVLQQLPSRSVEIVRIPPTDEQLKLHGANLSVATMIANKAFITEMDLLRLQKALLMARMSANSTFLVDKQLPAYSTKLDRIAELMEQMAAEPDRKAVLFSEWTTMLDLIEPILEKNKLDFVRLDGSVPQKKRQQLVNQFQSDPTCKLFITTNAGSTGLNLQAANTVINVDLPWNPAILEQRIGRAHRMGQKRPVQVFVLITEGTIEESLLRTLSEKKDLALAALDFESEVNTVDFNSSTESLKRRLELLIGSQPEAPLDVTARDRAETDVARFTQRRERVAAAGGELLGAVFQFLGELVSEEAAPASPDVVANLRDRLGQCVDEDEAGRPRLTVTLPNREALDGLAQTLARLLMTQSTAPTGDGARGEGNARGDGNPER